ncbi:hypothetical protein ASF61_11380 [Duganella sp. Leaf126]|uniref:O-antigen ligase family protein n=1 Tax=Duganella sp. Leaf126 TaxID=1736266 RepID=UPI0006FA447E|nr:O-antigen ligase family protein [Duganella sp. Leaf126]KQQ33654.1 hypothetical protein ASF61_11380 [Duganella sp. Leaf126]
MMNHNLSQKSAGTVFFNSLLFAPPFLFLTARGGTGLCSLVYVLAAIVGWRAVRTAMAPHWRTCAPLLLAFMVPLLLALADYVFDSGMKLRELERPVRALGAAAALLVVLAWRPSRRCLWWGLIAGAVAGAVLVGTERWVLGIERPGGLINAITFGDLSLCMGLMCLAVMGDFPGRAVLWPLLGALAGLLGLIATGTRGGWVAAVPAAVLLLRYQAVAGRRSRIAVALLVPALLSLCCLLPQTGVRERALQGVADVQQYLAGGETYTNVGVRLELWHTATVLIADRPWLGHGSMAAVARAKRALVDSGAAPAYILQFDHFHNDALHATVFGGVAGLLAWAGTLLLPFLFFRRQLHRGRSAQRDLAAPALAGMLLVVCYAGFGLTEVIFWTIHSSVFYALTLFMLAGLCLTAPPQSVTG